MFSRAGRLRPYAVHARAAPAATALVQRRDHRRGPERVAPANRGLPPPAACGRRVGRDRPRRDARAGRGLRHDQLQRGTRHAIPPAAEWTAGMLAMLRDAMLAAIEGCSTPPRAPWSRASTSTRFFEPSPSGSSSWRRPGSPRGSRLSATPPTPCSDARPRREPCPARRRAPARPALRRARGEAACPAIGTYEQEMRDYVYPFMRMTMEHDRQFGGGSAPRPRPARRRETR